MRLLFLGDVVGEAGRSAIIDALPALRERLKLDFVVINGENAAGGFGITEVIYNDLITAGADVVTTGNHVWAQKDTLVFIERSERLLRPLNYPPGTPGKGAGLFRARNGADVLVLNPMGQVFMGEMDSPFHAVEREVSACPLGAGADAILVDFHAEATSEKQALAHMLDGRVSVVVGTHTHVPTADERILPGGTAYMSDAGMCGDYQSVLGMGLEESVNRFVTRIPRSRFKPSTGVASLSGMAVDIDDKTGLAAHVSGFRMGGRLRPMQPDFWEPDFWQN